MDQQIKIGLCEWSLPYMGPYICQLASELGFSGLQLDYSSQDEMFPLNEKVVQEGYLKLAKQFNLLLPSMTVTELGRKDLFAEENSEIAKDMLKIACSAIDVSREMKVPLVMFPSFGESQLTEEKCERATVVFTQLCDYAAERSVHIATENTLGSKSMIKLYEAVNRDNFHVYLDTQNYYLNKGWQTVDLIDDLFTYSWPEIHIKDGQEGELSAALLGTGASDFMGSMKQLKAKNYRGWLIIENYYYKEPLRNLSQDPLELLKKDLAYTKKVSEELFLR